MQSDISASTESRIIPFAIALISGFLYAAGYPLLGSEFSIPLAPALGLGLFWNRTQNLTCLKTKMWLGLAFCLGLNLLGYYWIGETVREFGSIPAPFNYFILLLFTFLTLPQLLIFLLADHWLLKIPRYHAFRGPLVLAILYTLIEQHLPQQFPGFTGHSFLPLGKVLGLAPYLGAFFYSFVANWIAFSISQLSFKFPNPKILFPSFMLLLLTLVAGGLMPLQLPTSVPETPTLRVRFVQPNIGNNLKITSEKGDPFSLENVLKKFSQLSIGSGAGIATEAKPDLIIWPETAFPVSLNAAEMMNNPFTVPEIHRDIMAKTGAEILFGGYDNNPLANGFFESEFNAVFHLKAPAEVKSVYRKIRLLAFGEGLPFGPINQVLSSYMSNISFFAKGSQFTEFKTKGNHPFISVICYEILFPEFMRDFVNNVESYPQFIVNLTNDSWFGNTSEPHQHLFLAKWRALELGIPILRMTNTGISSILYEDSSESERIGIGEETAHDFVLPLHERKKTFYAAWGNLPTLLLMLLLLAGQVIYQIYFSWKPSRNKS
jgi:apolipoprotein N-acyltransferase